MYYKMLYLKQADYWLSEIEGQHWFIVYWPAGLLLEYSAS